MGAYWTHESILLENQGYPVHIMRVEEWGVPDYYELVLVTNESTIKSKPEVITRFLRAVRRGYEDAAQDPQAGVDILLKGTKAEVDEKIERPALNCWRRCGRRTRPRSAHRMPPGGRALPSGCRQTDCWRAMSRLGMPSRTASTVAIRAEGTYV